MSDISAVFPEPRNASWERMEVIGCDRHCTACNRTVHDLSGLRIDLAEGLLSSGAAICVRAKIGPDGVVELASNAERNSRKIVGTFGASLAMAATACQSLPSETARYTISGTVENEYILRTASLRSSDGQVWPLTKDIKRRRFTSLGLSPGLYTLSLNSGCGTEDVRTVVLRDASIDLGETETKMDCIIVGRFEPAPKTSRA